MRRARPRVIEASWPGADEVVDGGAAELEAGHDLGDGQQFQSRGRSRVEDGERGRGIAAPFGRELPFQFLAVPYGGGEERGAGAVARPR